MSRHLLPLLLVAACGGAASQPTTAQSTSAPSATETAPVASTTDDTSPQSIGTKHKKVGNGWFLSGGGKDESVRRDLRARRESRRDEAEVRRARSRWATVMKNVSSAPYIGKKIRVRIGVKANGVTHGEVWARSAAPHAAEDAPSITTPIDATSEMKDYDVTLDVKDGTRVVGDTACRSRGPARLRVGADSITIL